MLKYGHPRRPPRLPPGNRATREARARRIKAASAQDATGKDRISPSRIRKIPGSSRPGWKNSRQPYSKEDSKSMSIAATALTAATGTSANDPTPAPVPSSTDPVANKQTFLQLLIAQ